MSRATPNLEGQRFERLVAIKRVPGKDRSVWWQCKCDCGQTTAVRASFLVKRLTRSCGCLRRETYRETMRKARERSRNGNARQKAAIRVADALGDPFTFGRPKEAEREIAEATWATAREAIDALEAAWPI